MRHANAASISTRAVIAIIASAAHGADGTLAGSVAKALLHLQLIPGLHVVPHKPSYRAVHGFQALQTVGRDLDGVSLVGQDGDVVPLLALGGVIDPVGPSVLSLEDDAGSAEVELLYLDGDFVSGVCFLDGDVIITL